MLVLVAYGGVPCRVPEQSLYLDLGLKGKTCESVRSFLPFRIWADCIDPLSKFYVRRAFWLNPSQS